MSGATYEVLSQALDEMKEWYKDQAKRFSTHLLWFTTFLDRTDTVTPEDKVKVKQKMNSLEGILNENPFVQQREAEGFARGEAEGEARGFARGEAEGRAEGEARGLRLAVVAVVEGRFPALAELAQQRVAHVQKPDALTIALKGVATAPDEAAARWILDLLAA